ncbi:MAG TPA: flagellar hook-basal body complex protein, partial [Geminicoccaceae bacterium]
MSLFGSLFSGVSGLTAQSRAMGMISDNIANVNTTAYKGSSAQFSNLVTGQARARNYTPGGVRAGTSQGIANQGLIQGTSSPT